MFSLNMRKFRCRLLQNSHIMTIYTNLFVHFSSRKHSQSLYLESSQKPNEIILTFDNSCKTSLLKFHFPFWEILNIIRMQRSVNRLSGYQQLCSYELKIELTLFRFPWIVYQESQNKLKIMYHSFRVCRLNFWQHNGRFVFGSH